MTGSGKTGLVFIAVEEALRNHVPVLMIDVKGDLPNLLLSFPDNEPHHFEPWAEGTKAPETPGDPRSAPELAATVAEERKRALSSWGIDVELMAFHEKQSVRLITPGATSGEVYTYCLLWNVQANAGKPIPKRPKPAWRRPLR